jgi:hypothetical protein
VDGTGSGSCPLAGFGTDRVEPTASVTRKLVTRFLLVVMCKLQSVVTVRDVWVADNTLGSEIWRSRSGRVAVSHTVSFLHSPVSRARRCVVGNRPSITCASTDFSITVTYHI